MISGPLPLITHHFLNRLASYKSHLRVASTPPTIPSAYTASNSHHSCLWVFRCGYILHSKSLQRKTISSHRKIIRTPKRIRPRRIGFINLPRAAVQHITAIRPRIILLVGLPGHRVGPTRRLIRAELRALARVREGEGLEHSGGVETAYDEGVLAGVELDDGQDRAGDC